MNSIRKLYVLWNIVLIGIWLVATLACNYSTTRPADLVASSTPLAVTQAMSLQPSVTPTPTEPTAIPLPTDTLLPPTATPPTPTPQLVRFAVIGDFGQGDQAEEDVANLVKSWNPDFIITVGDNNYPSGSAETIDDRIGRFYHEFIHPYVGSFGPGAQTNRFFPTLGNHDWDTARAQAYFDYFTLPGNERYYDFTWGPLHFFAVSADSREPDGVGRSSIQAQWLKAGLAASQAAWKVVYFHQPPYSSGLSGPVDWMQWPFVEWGADVLFAGHDHVYERLDIGIPLFINGLGGGPIYYFTNIDSRSQVRYNANYGAMLVEADEYQMTFQFINRIGEIIDHYQIIK